MPCLNNVALTTVRKLTLKTFSDSDFREDV